VNCDFWTRLEADCEVTDDKSIKRPGRALMRIEKLDKRKYSHSKESASLLGKYKLSSENTVDTALTDL
jgi:hypothetical protein